MPEYVLVYPKLMYHRDEWGPDIGHPAFCVLLVRKNKPQWQVGRLNLVGGRIEEGETPTETAIRELQEEAGLEGIRPSVMGKIDAGDTIIWCVYVEIRSDELSPRPEETELVEWASWMDAKNDSKLIPNLKLIIPLMEAGVEGWTIEDKDSSEGKGSHTLKVII